MLKNVIEKELKEQKISRALLLDGICEEQEFFLWVEEGEPAVWVMQVLAMAQRRGKTVDNYDVMLSAEQYLLALGRSVIWQEIRKGELDRARVRIYEYEQKLEEMGVACAAENRSDHKRKVEVGGIMPRGECALHRQFLALSLAEIARRQARPYTEQSKIILGGLRQTFSGEVYGKREPEPGWCRMKRMHLMELFLLARFARLCECMGKEEEAFLWYDELAAYLCKVPKDRADTGKLYPLLCYRMAKNRLRGIFGDNMWWEEGRCKAIWSSPGTKKTVSRLEPEALFAGQNGAERFKDAKESIKILEDLTDGLKLLGLTQRNFPLFLKMEFLRLGLLRGMPYFGDHKEEESTSQILLGAWEDICELIVSNSGDKSVYNGMDDFDDLDSDYAERCMHNLPEILGERLYLLGLDVYQLGEDIYSDPIKSLMPILKGKATPKPQKLQMLQKRLKMNWKMYDPGFITEEDGEYKKFALMFRMYGDGKFEEGRKLLSELEEKLNWKYMTNEQFGVYWDALFDWKEGKITEEEKNQEMWKVVEYSGVKREKFAEVGCSLMRLEWWALMEISWNYEGEDKSFWIKVLKKQRKYLEDKRAIGFFPEYYIKILYCLCHMEREMGNPDEAMQCANAGLRAVYHLNLYTQWGALLFEKFRIVEDLKSGKGMEEKDFRLIRQAYAVEKLFSKNDMFCRYIEDYLDGHYEKDMLADMNRG